MDLPKDTNLDLPRSVDFFLDILLGFYVDSRKGRLVTMQSVRG